MATDSKYGNLDIPGIPADEPVFVLRAQDVFSIPTIMRYKLFIGQITTDERPPHSFIEGIEQVMTTFRDWQNANESKVKVPD